MSLLLGKQLTAADMYSGNTGIPMTPVALGGLTCPAGVAGAISGVCRLQPILHHRKKFVDFAAQPLRKLWCELKEAWETHVGAQFRVHGSP